MSQPAEQLEPLEINSEDDVWNAWYIYGIESLGPILNFYGHKTEEEIEEEEKRSKKEKKSEFVEHNPKAPQKNVRKIKEFFSSLVDEQAEEALMYLVEKKDEEGLIMFYQSFELNRAKQRMIIEKMLFEAFESRQDKKFDDEIRKLRKKLFIGQPPENLNDAVGMALNKNPAKAILFLKEDIFKISQFIDSAPEDAVVSVLLEMLKYIPDHT